MFPERKTQHTAQIHTTSMHTHVISAHKITKRVQNTSNPQRITYKMIGSGENSPMPCVPNRPATIKPAANHVDTSVSTTRCGNVSGFCNHHVNAIRLDYNSDFEESKTFDELSLPGLLLPS